MANLTIRNLDDEVKARLMSGLG
ncbi:FitA-like ribbon-helix-helix domain-containing protein [Thiohalorhabdus methylotrophus]|uniref:Antitoxin FitA-like ribbon-helix-helix domain-containing protein n=1 Tax=Thiohalorhabdus methylotrophus TaxID=3242694 RepID=A0ABV4TZ60_9GAMM